MKSGYTFFLSHAGYSYDPQTETPLRGRQRCAKRLADAERAAYDADVTFSWDVDDIDSSDFSDDPNPWQLWCCVARTSEGDVFASLSGIDFGRDGEPWGDPYRRVVEAELASERF